MTNWIRLADAVAARRSELMLSQSELAAKAGISESTVRSIEKVRRDGYRASTLRDLSRALGWTPMSIDLILTGGDPVVAEEADEPDDDLRGEVRRLRDELAELRAAILNLSAERR